MAAARHRSHAHRSGDAERQGEERARRKADRGLVIDRRVANQSECGGRRENRGQHRCRETDGGGPGPGRDLVEGWQVEAHEGCAKGGDRATGGQPPVIVRDRTG